jgi:hypothetical protein
MPYEHTQNAAYEKLAAAHNAACVFIDICSFDGRCRCFYRTDGKPAAGAGVCKQRQAIYRG